MSWTYWNHSRKQQQDNDDRFAANTKSTQGAQLEVYQHDKPTSRIFGAVSMKKHERKQSHVPMVSS